MSAVTDYQGLLRELAVPRLVGTRNHQQVRDVLKRELVVRGFVVEEHAFTGRPSRALFGTPRLVSGLNIIAQRPSGRPTVWLVGHYDSKGQPLSMAVRLAAFCLIPVALVGLLFAPLPAALFLVLLLLELFRNRVTDDSPGAVDNATALVAVFMTLDQLPRSAQVGVIFPDAEEFGLVGARALATERSALLADTAIINLDGLDDVGSPIAFLHRPGAVGHAVARALAATRARWLPVIVDGIALSRVAGECVTILKGNWRTMRVVHTPQDNAERLTLRGARDVAAGLARALSTA